jgi:hypothetical protein
MIDEEQVNQALAELWDIVKCRCHEAYTGRGLHDPDCECDSAEAVKIVADRIKALTEQLAAARQDAKEAEAYAEELEAKLAKAVEAAQATIAAKDAENAKLHDRIEGVARGTHKIMVGYEAKLAKAVEALEKIAGAANKEWTTARCGGLCDIARATLAEIKGESREALP